MTLPDTLNQAWADDTTTFGYKLLVKMGWSEGKGLGKNEDGRSTHIRVKRKRENLGIGCEGEDHAGNTAFVNQISNFNDVLASLNEDTPVVNKPKKTAKTKKKKKSKSKDKTVAAVDSSDDDDVIKKKKKKKRKGGESKEVKRKSSSVAYRRNHRILKSKNVSNYSSNDLKAILGGI